MLAGDKKLVLKLLRGKKDIKETLEEFKIKLSWKRMNKIAKKRQKYDIFLSYIGCNLLPIFLYILVATSPKKLQP